jgi:hypothetical protein
MSGGVYLSEAFVTQVEGNFDLQTGGYLVVLYNGSKTFVQSLAYVVLMNFG